MLLACIIIFILMWCAYFYIQYNYSKNLMNSDAAAELLFAQQLYEEHSLLSKNLAYTTELRLFEVQLFTAPLFGFVKDWMTIKALGDAACYLLYFAAAVALMKRLFGMFSYKMMLYSLALLFPVSYFYYYMALSGDMYTLKIVLSFFILFLFYSLSPGLTKGKTAVTLLLLASASLIAGLKGIRITIVIYLPLIITCFLLSVKRLKDISDLESVKKQLFSVHEFRQTFYAIAFGLLNLAGYWINENILSEIYTFESQQGVRFGDLQAETLAERISGRLGDLLSVLGYSANAEVFSLSGIQNVLIVLLIGCVFYITWHILKHFDSYSLIQQNMTVLVWIIFLFNQYILIFTDNYAKRYFIPLIVFFCFLFAIYFNNEVRSLQEHFIKTFIAVVLVSYITIGSGLSLSVFNPDHKGNAEREPAIEYLKQNHYDFGFATYWNASVTAALSNGQVEVANIASPDMDFFIWGTNKKYYKEGYHEGKCFMLLTVSETTEWAECIALKNGTEVYRDEYFVIYSYDNVGSLLQMANRTYLNE